MEYWPEIVQVVPFEDFTVDVYFSDGKIVNYDAHQFLKSPIFEPIKDGKDFCAACRIMNDTLAWDVGGDNSLERCVDIDPFTLYEMPAAKERLV